MELKRREAARDNVIRFPVPWMVDFQNKFKKDMECLGQITKVFIVQNGGDFKENWIASIDYFMHDPRFKSCILPRLKTEFPWLLDRPATEADFHDFCKREYIKVIFSPRISHGNHALYDAGRFILLNPNLNHPQLRYEMFREVAHYLFHEPAKRLATGPACNAQSETKKHIEAEIVTSLCNIDLVFVAPNESLESKLI